MSSHFIFLTVVFVFVRKANNILQAGLSFCLWFKGEIGLINVFNFIETKLDVVCVHVFFAVCVFVLQGGGAGEQANRQPYSPQQPLHPGRPWKQLLRHTHTRTWTHFSKEPTTNANKGVSNRETHSAQPYRQPTQPPVGQAAGRWAVRGCRCGFPVADI